MHTYRAIGGIVALLFICTVLVAWYWQSQITSIDPSPSGTVFPTPFSMSPSSTPGPIRVTAPHAHAQVGYALRITGEARGTWFFEASFPVHLEDMNGNIIASGVAQSDGEWMTEDFVPFTAELNIPNTFTGSAVLVVLKDNPSGLPENDASLRIPITVTR